MTEIYHRLMPNSDQCITHMVWRDTPFSDSGVVACKIKFSRSNSRIRLHMVEGFPEYFQKLALLRTQFEEVRVHLDKGLLYRWKGELSTSDKSSAWGVFFIRKSGSGRHVSITLADCTQTIAWIDCKAFTARRLVERSIQIIDEHIKNLNELSTGIEVSHRPNLAMWGN